MQSKSLLPWLRTLLAFPAGVVSIGLFHQLAGLVLPALYGSDLATDRDRLLMLVLAVLAGVVGSFVVAFVARHRLWLHMAIFLLIMAGLDLRAVFGYLSPQPFWFKALVIGTLPVQAWIGGILARAACRKAYQPAA